MRTGINTGEVVAGDPTERHAFATGEAVALAQRLEATASPGEILLGEKTYRLVTVLGAAGIGKSRLMNELLADTRAEARVLLGRCLPYGEGITYWPLRDLIRDAARELSQEAIQELMEGEPEAERIAARISGAIGLREMSASPEDTMWAVRLLLEHLAREQPLIVGFDDLQWAESTFVDLIEYLCGWVRDAPMLIVCLARPELLDRHPAWIARGEAITLDPLSELQAEELLEHLRGETEVGDELLVRITRAAEGNPLFVEQMLAMLTENGTTTADLAIPPTIHALLAARLDRLAHDERAVIERASVIGKEFWRTAIAELSSDPERTVVGASLMTLARKELIEPAQSTFFSEDAFKFRHILI